MRIITDSPEFARKIHPDMQTAWRPLSSDDTPATKLLIHGILNTEKAQEAEVASKHNWHTYCLTAASENSQYDLLVKLAQVNSPLPNGLLCLAGEGRGFHGFRKRAWAAPPGNIYVSCYWSPNVKIEHAGVAWMVLAAVSVVDAIDLLPGLKGQASIKWVNDILIDGAKVCGVLAHSLTEGDITTGAILGIGLNVTKTPEVEPTPYVRKAACLADFAESVNAITQASAMAVLSHSLDVNYRRLISGDYASLLARYRERSAVIGRRVRICRDTAEPEPPELARGEVVAIGDDLELFLKDRKDPVASGRLILEDLIRS